MSAAQNDIISAPVCASTLHARHLALLEAEASDLEIDAVLELHVAELRRLAGTSARTPEQIRAKAAALATCVVRGRNRPAAIMGDYGLAASILDDLLNA